MPSNQRSYKKDKTSIECCNGPSSETYIPPYALETYIIGPTGPMGPTAFPK